MANNNNVAGMIPGSWLQWIIYLFIFFGANTDDSISKNVLQSVTSLIWHWMDR